MTATSWPVRLTISVTISVVPISAVPIEVYRAHVARYSVPVRRLFMLTTREGVQGFRLDRGEVQFLPRAGLLGLSVLSQVRPSTGEP